MSELIVAAAPIVRQADVIDRLPAEAAERLQNLRTLREQAGDLARSMSHRADAARLAFRDAEDALGRLEAAYERGGVERTTFVRDDPDPLKYMPAERKITEFQRVAPDVERMRKERSRVVRLRADWQRRQAEVEALSGVMSARGNLLTSVENYLRSLSRDAVIELDDGGAPKMPKGDITAAVEHCREQIRALREEQRDVEDAPRPASQIKEALAGHIDRMARRPDITGLMQTLAPPVMPTRRVVDLSAIMSDGGAGVVGGSLVDTAGIFAWLCRDQLIEALGELVDAEAEDDVALTDDERAARIADLKGSILEVERTEVAYLDLAAEKGAPMLPRSDTDPRAFLCLSSSLPEPRKG